MPATTYTLAARIAEEPLARLVRCRSTVPGYDHEDDFHQVADAILDGALDAAAVAVFHHALAALPTAEAV